MENNRRRCGTRVVCVPRLAMCVGIAIALAFGSVARAGSEWDSGQCAKVMAQASLVPLVTLVDSLGLEGEGLGHVRYWASRLAVFYDDMTTRPNLPFSLRTQFVGQEGSDFDKKIDQLVLKVKEFNPAFPDQHLEDLKIHLRKSIIEHAKTLQTEAAGQRMPQPTLEEHLEKATA